MSKSKIWLTIATSSVLIGGIIFVSIMTVLGWDFTGLSEKNQTNEYVITESYTDISVNTETADIVFLPSQTKESVVVCREREKLAHSVSVKDGRLTVELIDSRKWYEHIGFNFGELKITVYIPSGEYGALLIKGSTGDIDLSKDFKFKSIDISTSSGDVTSYASALGDIKIETSTGRIRTESISAESLSLSVSTGDVGVSQATVKGDVKIHVSTGDSSLSGVRCNNLSSDGSTGDVFLDDVIASQKLSIERSTGDVELRASDAAEIFIVTSTGDVEGTLLSDKVFIVETDTGERDLPSSITGGRCEISTSTGDIEFQIIRNP